MTTSNFISSKHNISSNELKKNIDNLAEELITKQQNIGLVVSIYRENKDFTYTYGYSDRLKKYKIKKNTIFAIGSLTKPMIASLLLILDQKGLLSINDKVGDILPKNLSYKDINVKNITLKQLASHSSGLPREPMTTDGLLLALEYSFTGKNIYSYIDEKFILNYLSTVTINKNNIAEYSNIGSGLLGYLISLKMGKSLDELLTKYLFKPLKMKNTRFTLNKKQKQYLSEGHVGDFPLFMKRNKILKNWKFTDSMKATGGLYSNAKDLIKFLKANLAESNTDLDNILKKSHKIIAKNKKLSYTMGWQVKYFPQYNKYIYYKYGLIAGFSCYMGMELNNKTAIVVLKNNFNWEDKIGHEILLKMALSNNNF